MIAVLPHALRPFYRLSLGWLAVAAYGLSLPATSLGVAVAALGLLDEHELEASSQRGDDLVIVLHHDERHSHLHGRPAHEHDEGSTRETTFAGVAHDEDHVLVLPGALDSTARSDRFSIQPPPVVKSFAAFAAACVRVDSRVLRIAKSFCSTQPRAGPLACLRTTELRI